MKSLVCLTLWLLMWIIALIIDLLSLQRRIQADSEYLTNVSQTYKLYLKQDRERSFLLSNKIRNL